MLSQTIWSFGQLQVICSAPLHWFLFGYLFSKEEVVKCGHGPKCTQPFQESQKKHRPKVVAYGVFHPRILEQIPKECYVNIEKF